MLDITLLNYKELFDKLEADYGQGDWEVATSDGGDNSRHIVREKKGKKRIICHVDLYSLERHQCPMFCSPKSCRFVILVVMRSISFIHLNTLFLLHVSTVDAFSRALHKWP